MAKVAHFDLISKKLPEPWAKIHSEIFPYSSTLAIREEMLDKEFPRKTDLGSARKAFLQRTQQLENPHYSPWLGLDGKPNLLTRFLMRQEGKHAYTENDMTYVWDCEHFSPRYERLAAQFLRDNGINPETDPAFIHLYRSRSLIERLTRSFLNFWFL